MSDKPTIIQPTLADAFEIGQREGLREAFTEVKNMLEQSGSFEATHVYVSARLKSIQDFSLNNPFKQKDGT